MKTKTMMAAALIGGLMPVTLPLPMYAAKADANICLDRDPVLAENVRVNKPPQSASTIVHLTNVMYVVGSAIKTLDRLCTHEPNYAEVRASYQASYDGAKTACLQLASSPSYCVETPYARRF